MLIWYSMQKENWKPNMNNSKEEKADALRRIKLFTQAVTFMGSENEGYIAPSLNDIYGNNIYPDSLLSKRQEHVHTTPSQFLIAVCFNKGTDTVNATSRTASNTSKKEIRRRRASLAREKGDNRRRYQEHTARSPRDFAIPLNANSVLKQSELSAWQRMYPGYQISNMQSQATTQMHVGKITNDVISRVQAWKYIQADSCGGSVVKFEDIKAVATTTMDQNNRKESGMALKLKDSKNILESQQNNKFSQEIPDRKRKNVCSGAAIIIVTQPQDQQNVTCDKIRVLKCNKDEFTLQQVKVVDLVQSNGIADAGGKHDDGAIIANIPLKKACKRDIVEDTQIQGKTELFLEPTSECIKYISNGEGLAEGRERVSGQAEHAMGNKRQRLSDGNILEGCSENDKNDALNANVSRTGAEKDGGTNAKSEKQTTDRGGSWEDVGAHLKTMLDESVPLQEESCDKHHVTECPSRSDVDESMASGQKSHHPDNATFTSPSSEANKKLILTGIEERKKKEILEDTKNWQPNDGEPCPTRTEYINKYPYLISKNVERELEKGVHMKGSTNPKPDLTGSRLTQSTQSMKSMSDNLLTGSHEKYNSCLNSNLNIYKLAAKSIDYVMSGEIFPCPKKEDKAIFKNFGLKSSPRVNTNKKDEKTGKEGPNGIANEVLSIDTDKEHGEENDDKNLMEDEEDGGKDNYESGNEGGWKDTEVKKRMDKHIMDGESMGNGNKIHGDDERFDKIEMSDTYGRGRNEKAFVDYVDIPRHDENVKQHCIGNTTFCEQEMMSLVSFDRSAENETGIGKDSEKDSSMTEHDLEVVKERSTYVLRRQNSIGKATNSEDFFVEREQKPTAILNPGFSKNLRTRGMRRTMSMISKETRKTKERKTRSCKGPFDKM